MGRALQFDGVDDYVIRSSLAGLPTGNAPRTVSLWIRSAGARPQEIFGGYGNVSACQNFQLGVANFDQSKIGFFGWSSCDYTTAIGSTTIADNAFHHLAVTYDGATLRFYVDGTLRDSVSRSLATQASTLCVGGEVNGSSCDRWFGGAIDDFRIYNRALSQLEVAALYALGESQPASLPTAPTNLRIVQ
jgi:hypothetical protein